MPCFMRGILLDTKDSNSVKGASVKKTPLCGVFSESASSYAAKWETLCSNMRSFVVHKFLIVWTFYLKKNIQAIIYSEN